MKFAPYKKDVIYWLVIISLLGCLYLATNKCTTYKETNTNNIEAFTDSITTYKSKNGELVASKTMIEGKFNDLKKINSELYEKIKAMSIGGEPDHIVHTNNTIVNELHDTLLIVKDSVANFNFENSYRALSGTIHTNKDSLNLSITKDEVYFDYTVVLKDNKVWLSSSNPYVKYNKITGLTLPTQKQKRWGIGPAITTGYDPANNKISMMLGVSLSYHIFKW